MISFKAFIGAIHDAILAANDSLMEKNTGLLDKYFDAPGDEEDIRRTIEDVLDTAKSLYSEKDEVDQEEYEKVLKGLEYARKALEGKEPDEKTKARGAHSPKSVVIEYPRQTSSGVEYTEVHVPLITLVPLAMSEIKEAKLTADFELEIVDNEVQINLRGEPKKGKLFGKKPESTFGRLEITIGPQESSEGLKRLVEGYENALKSQIPH